MGQSSSRSKKTKSRAKVKKAKKNSFKEESDDIECIYTVEHINSSLARVEKGDRIYSTDNVDVVVNCPPRAKKEKDELDSIKENVAHNGTEEQPIIHRIPRMNREERSKRCASIGPLVSKQRRLDRAPFRNVNARISMYELASDGWRYGVGGKRVNILNIDQEVSEIVKNDIPAVVQLGDLKLIF